MQFNKAFSYTGTPTWIRGARIWKFGGDNRVYQPNNTQGAAGMTFGFNRGFTQGPNPNAEGATSGFGFASFMLGTPAGGTVGFGAPVTLNPAVGNAGAAREAQFHCAAQLLRASPNG